MRPAVRLSALMKLPVVWVWTHDSVGLGEDGPTHQPVETYAALRAIPFLWFMRPADASETSYAWQVALERTDGPVAFAFSRQKVPTLDRSDLGPASGVERGAYTLWESSASPDLILIATGTEVGLALEAGRKIAGDGTAVRVVSMPCWELFEEQPADYREEVLPPEVGARLSIEAGVSFGWSKWVGDHGDSISIEHFGASAPGATVLEHFGYNLDNVVARATLLLERVA
jgi:transketolase